MTEKRLVVQRLVGALSCEQCEGAQLLKSVAKRIHNKFGPLARLYPALEAPASLPVNKHDKSLLLNMLLTFHLPLTFSACCLCIPSCFARHSFSLTSLQVRVSRFSFTFKSCCSLFSRCLLYLIVRNYACRKDEFSNRASPIQSYLSLAAKILVGYRTTK